MLRVAVLLGCILVRPASAGDAWQVSAPVVIAEPATIEAVLSPDLHIRASQGLDLRVLGPEGKPRAFELYWREQTGKTSLKLSPRSVQLEGKSFIWKADIPKMDRFKVSKLEILVRAGDYAGTVRIDGFIDGQWKQLARDAAVYSAKGTIRAEVGITPGTYESFKLVFSASGKKPVPVESITAAGEKLGKDYAEVGQAVEFKTIQDGSDVVVDARLPGSGIWIREIKLTSGAKFTGQWSLQRETIRACRKEFITERNGMESGIGKGGGTLRLPLERVWEGSSVRIRLGTGERYIGGVNKLTALVRLPRLVFVAEKPGKYLIQAGSGDPVAVREAPSDPRSTGIVEAKIGKSRTNPEWKPQDLVALYRLGGAAFDPSGYRWRSAVSIRNPGYYRILLNLKASLEKNHDGLRVVHDKSQVPFFMDPGEEREVPVSIREETDSNKNRTIWHIELPLASGRWTGLRVRANGIFSRSLILEREIPEPVGKQVLARLAWVINKAEPAALNLGLSGLPDTESSLRLIMEHGDNRPLKLDGITAVYRAPAIYFLADSGDGYELYGGNEKTRLPRYDLELVQYRLATHVPLSAILSDPEPFRGGNFASALLRPFTDTNWGLYCILGLLALVLAVVIARLFPKPTAPKRKSN